MSFVVQVKNLRKELGLKSSKSDLQTLLKICPETLLKIGPQTSLKIDPQLLL